MLDRRTARFRAAVELAEHHCDEAGVEISPESIDAVARSWIEQVAAAERVSPQMALAAAPHDFGELIAALIIEAASEEPEELRPFGRDAVVYVTAPAGGTCARCDRPIAGGTEVASVAGLHGRGLAHPECV